MAEYESPFAATDDPDIGAAVRCADGETPPARAVEEHAVPEEDSRPLESDPLTESSDTPPDGQLDATLLSEVTRAVNEFHDRARDYESRIRQLQELVDALQRDQVRTLLRPMLENLASLHAQANTTAQTSDGTADPVDAEYFVVKIEEIFSLHGISSVGAVPGSTFDARFHHAMRAVPTSEASLDGTVQRVLRQGFAEDGAQRVLIPARVAVHRYHLGSAPSGDSARAVSGNDCVGPVTSSSAMSSRNEES